MKWWCPVLPGKWHGPDRVKIVEWGGDKKKNSDIYSTSPKCGHTYSFKGFSLFYYCRIIVKTSKLWNNTYITHHVATKKVFKQIKIYFWFFKNKLFTLMTALHTLGILSTRFTWNAFPTVLKEFPPILSTCWLIFLHSTVPLFPTHTSWRCVGSLSCWKTTDSPTKRKPDGMANRCRMLWYPCWLSVPWIIN